MTSAPSTRQTRDADPPVQRLLMVADSAVADTDELPPPVRALLAEADEVYVVTPSLPGALPGWQTTSISLDTAPTSGSTRC